MSVPHMASTVSGMIVPSWLRGPRGRPDRVAAARPFSRISRRTRSFEVRRPPCAQPRPDLAIALAMKRAVREHLPDRLDQRGVGHRPLRSRPAPRRRRRFRHAPAPIEARPDNAPDATDPGHTVAAMRGDRDDGAHRFDLRAAKGLRRSPPAARSSSVAVRYPSSAPRPWSAAGRSSRRAHPAPATSGPPTRHRERCRASRSKPPPSPPAPAQRSPAARPAAPAAPRRASAQPSSAAPAPEPRPLRYPRSPRPRLLPAQRHPSQHPRRLSLSRLGCLREPCGGGAGQCDAAARRRPELRGGGAGSLPRRRHGARLARAVPARGD